jgi:alpha-amylase
VAWYRKGDEEHDGCVTVVCNGKADGEKKVEVGKEHAGEKWTDAMGWHQGEVTIDEGASVRSVPRGAGVLCNASRCVSDRR